MKDLIERLEKATGPNYEIEHDIARIIGGYHEGTRLTNFPNYTASLDAALTLVPEGFTWELLGDESDCGALVYQNDVSCGGSSRTPAIALCLAALKASTAVNLC